MMMFSAIIIICTLLVASTSKRTLSSFSKITTTTNSSDDTASSILLPNQEEQKHKLQRYPLSRSRSRSRSPSRSRTRSQVVSPKTSRGKKLSLWDSLKKYVLFLWEKEEEEHLEDDEEVVKIDGDMETERRRSDVIPVSFAPYIFTNNMTLQREPQSAVLWGTAPPNTTLTLEVSTRGTWQTTSNNDGTWSITLDPQGATSNVTLILSKTATGKATKSDDKNTGTSDDAVILENVAFGDVYLCSGQSNMVMSINAACVHGPEECYKEMNDASSYPDIRLLTVGMQKRNEPTSTIHPSTLPGWYVSGPDSFYHEYPDNIKKFGYGFEYFSAVCYYFGRELYKANSMNNNGTNAAVPIGLISSSVGGTKIQTWMSPASLKKCETEENEILMKTKTTEDDFVYATEKEKTRKKKVQHQRAQQKRKLSQFQLSPYGGSSCLWNGMIYPLLNMTLSGIVWYQGESNYDEYDIYPCLFSSMIDDWTSVTTTTTGLQKKQQPQQQLPFLFVQLAPMQMNASIPSTYEKEHYEYIRQAQAKGGGVDNDHYQKNNTAMVVALDLGDIYSPLGDVHPRRKQEIGRRLSLAARKLIYNEVDLISNGPTLMSYSVFIEDGMKNIRIVLQFDEITSGKKLHFQGSSDCRIIGGDGPWCCDVSPFAILLKDKDEKDDNDKYKKDESWILTPSDCYTVNKENATITVNLTKEFLRNHEDSDDKNKIFSTIRALSMQWRTVPPCVLYGSTGLPAPPFKIDIGIEYIISLNKDEMNADEDTSALVG